MVGQCPVCEQPVMHIEGAEVKISVGQSSYRGLSYTCPECRSILSVGIDPASLTADIVAALKKSRMGHHRDSIFVSIVDIQKLAGHSDSRPPMRVKGHAI